MGKEEPGKPRPIKVELTNAGDVQFALVNARKLKTSNLSTVYLGPDRTRDERLAHSKLVKEMKELIKKDPNTNRHYFIRNNKAFVVLIRPYLHPSKGMCFYLACVLNFIQCLILIKYVYNVF
jgi:hypothetical protein